MPCLTDTTVWVDNTPETLFKQVTRFCVRNMEVFTVEMACGSLKLQNSLYLPLEICRELLNVIQEEKIDVDDKITNIFADLQNTRLSQVKIKNSSLTDVGLSCLLGHNLRSLSLNNCTKLTTETLEILNGCSDNLISLSLVESYQIFPHSLSSELLDEDEDEDTTDNIYENRHFIIKAPLLKHLCIRDLYIIQGRNYFNILTKALPHLSHLDLSGVSHCQSIENLNFLMNCPKLVILKLHNVKEVKNSLKTLCQLKMLEHLDISQYDELHGDYDQPALFLDKLVTELPKLRSLDISGTNLDGDFHNKGIPCDGKLCDIPGLSSRSLRPFEFLGIYRTVHKSSRREDIPALSVSGSTTEKQILVAAKHYLERPLVMENVLEDLLDRVRSDTCSLLQEIVDVTALVMSTFVREKKIQRYATALLYYLLQNMKTSSSDFNIKSKQIMVGVLLDTMMANKDDSVIMRNGCMALWQFQIPEDLMYHYVRVVDILLYIGEFHPGTSTGDDNYIQRAAVFLLNGLVCHVDGFQKKVCGEKIIDAMLRIVKQKLAWKLCDDAMETAWSTMWNVTDETPDNSSRFLDQAGMELFLQCKQAFPLRIDLLRNMMGLLGNVAEVKKCRKRLMTSDFVAEFSFLLDSQTDGIEVSYNAAGVLSHMTSDGADAWTIPFPSREHVLERLVRAVQRWDLSANRNINYRSLAPIIGLLEVDHTPECQLWATWAIANLIKFNENKYCPLVEEEGGLRRIKGIIEQGFLTNPQPSELMEKMFRIGQVAVTNIELWKKRQNNAHLETEVQLNQNLLDSFER